MASQPLPGFVRFILLSQKNEDPFYLDIPIAIVDTLCLRPRKYLRYIGWCVLGVVGDLVDEKGANIALDGKLLNQGIYKYRVSGENVLAYAVDLEVIKQRSDAPSESTQTREDFSSKLLERDHCCVWTGVKGRGLHIIPYARGDEWLQCIIENRPHDENLDSLSINDIRNGFSAEGIIHNQFFNPRDIAVLKTPNVILETTDIPANCQRNIRPGVCYPSDNRYTFQWLVAPEHDIILERYPNNNDATFKKNTQLPKPADLLLHYNYGAAAVLRWGKNKSALHNRFNIPHSPSIPVSEKKRRRIKVTDLEEQGSWDADDVMLFFWGNSKAATERHVQKEKERTEYLEGWRAGVSDSFSSNAAH